MPDIKTALTNAIQEKQMQTATPAAPDTVLKTVREWAADDARARIPREITPKYTGYLSRDIFLFVQANPKKTYKQVEAAMAALPYKYNISSCGTLLSQMRKAGLMDRDAASQYVVLRDSYIPVDKKKVRYSVDKPRPKKPAAKAGVRGKISRAPVAPVAPKPQPAPAPVNELEQILTRLTFVQALELYKKLRDMLGSATRMPLP